MVVEKRDMETLLFFMEKEIWMLNFLPYHSSLLMQYRVDFVVGSGKAMSARREKW